jgi:hypothetical protein
MRLWTLYGCIAISERVAPDEVDGILSSLPLVDRILQ